jgi:hypothetical protein
MEAGFLYKRISIVKTVIESVKNKQLIGTLHSNLHHDERKINTQGLRSCIKQLALA